ncbi:MAG: hypothetical protein AAGA23_19945 [Pseudomonadota bacterium]
MPSFAVHIRVEGPFRDVADGAEFTGAYYQRVVSAADEQAAINQAIEALRREPRFAELTLLDGSGPPETEVDSVTQVGWLDRFFGGAPLVFCRDSLRSLKA